MKLLRPIGLFLLLAALFWPEPARYGAERRVGAATAAFRGLVAKANEPETAREISGVGESVLTSAKRLPGDPRPWILAGSSFLVTGRPDRALEYYREAFATGERAEIDLNLGRAYSLLRRKESMDAAFLRAGWVSPEILEALPAEVKDPLRFEIARLSDELRRGRLTAPPPLPPEERR